MKKLTWCLLPLVGLIAAACGGEGSESANNAPPPAVQEPAHTGPNGEVQPFQPAENPVGVQGGGNQCASACEGQADPAGCRRQCECVQDCDDGDVDCLTACASL